MAMARILTIMLLMVTPIVSYSSERIEGVWDWYQYDQIRRSDVARCSKAKLLFESNGNAIYKLPGKVPITAQWKLCGDTLTVTSENFIWDFRFYQFGFEFFKTVDYDYPPEKNGKLLSNPGEYESYIIQTDSILFPIDNDRIGWLKKSDMTQDEFLHYDVSTMYDFYVYRNIEGKTYSNAIPEHDDYGLKKILECSYPATQDVNPRPHLLEEIPSKIDSIGFKLINFFQPFDEYFAIDRKAFDKTYDYLLEHDDSAELTYITTKDSTIISQLCEMLNDIKPFPTEAVSITPNNAYRQSRGDTGYHGIYTDRRQNNDPIEVRGKIILYSGNETINCYLSTQSIDYMNYRYEISHRLYLFLFYLEIKEAFK